jgi:uncharacterized Zn-finger protein
MVVHTRERPEQCDMCHRSFSQRASLLKHIRTFHPNHPILTSSDDVKDI